jgi:hypothetical protein
MKLNAFLSSPPENVEVGHVLPAGRALVQTPSDLLRHTLIQGTTGTGKTSSLITPYCRYLKRLHDEAGVGGLVFDFSGGTDERTGFVGSLNLEGFCDLVFAADEGAQSARFNPLRVGGAGFSTMLWDKDEIRGNGGNAFYVQYGMRFVQSFVDLLLWAERFIAQAEASGERLPVPLSLTRPSVAPLQELLTMNALGLGIANAMLGLISTAKKRGRELPSDLDIGQLTSHLVAYKAGGRTRHDHLHNLDNAVNQIFHLRGAYQTPGYDLLDDGQPLVSPARTINIQDCVEGGKIVGFRLTEDDGFAAMQLARCVLKLFTKEVLRKQRPRLSTMLILDEAPTVVDKEFGRFLSRARASGGAAVLAFQHRQQFGDDAVLLGELWQNATNHWLVLPLPLNEAAYYEQLFGTVEHRRLQANVSYAPAPGQRQGGLLDRLLGDTHVRTGHTVSPAHVHEPLFPRHFLAYERHKAVFNGLTGGALVTAAVQLSPHQPPTRMEVAR